VILSLFHASSYSLNQASMGKVSVTMDIWSDQNLRPFLAMTAHWVAKVEGTTTFQLKTALIAFHRLRGRHDGKTLAETVMDILDRAEMTSKVRLFFMSAVTTMLVSDVSFKIGHFTMDNAGNNGTMMQSLQTMLKERDIIFNPVDRKVMCFAHVVDLSSGRVVRNADNMVDDDGDDFPRSGNEATVSGPIARGRNVVRVIRGSGMRRDAFDEAIENGNAKGRFKRGRPLAVVKIKPLQLLRDVRTRWDSTYHMVNRLREMRPVCFYS
jgi:hypothetical protein